MSEPPANPQQPPRPLAPSAGKKAQPKRPGSDPRKHGEKEKRKLDKDIVIPVVLFLGSAGFFTLFNDFLELVGVHVAKPLCITLGLLSLELGIAHLLIKSRWGGAKFKRVVKWSYGSAAAVQLIVAGYAVFIPEKAKDFSVHCMRYFHHYEGRRGMPRYFFLSGEGADETAYPVHIAMHVRFTNLKAVPVAVGDFSLETQVSNKWHDVPVIAVQAGKLLMTLAYTNAAPVTFDSKLLASLFDRQAALPHVPVFGMIFMEMPKVGLGPRWRFRLRTSEGVESIQPITFSPETQVGYAPIHSLTFEFGVGDYDLTKIKQRYYHDN